MTAAVTVHLPPPHLRLTLSGTLPSSEQFSCSLSLKPQNTTIQNWLSGLFDESIAANNFGALVAVCTDYWHRPLMYISDRAVLKSVKLAPIDAQGHYSGAPREAAVNVTGGIVSNGGTTEMVPFQVARKVTLETDGYLGRIKGGFFLPGVTGQGFDPGSNLTSVAVITDIRNTVHDFIAAVNNAPGLDATGSYKVVVASGGRYRAGQQVQAPALWDVKRVNVGRRVDVQRRRGNKIGEARIADATV